MGGLAGGVWGEVVNKWMMMMLSPCLLIKVWKILYLLRAFELEFAKRRIGLMVLKLGVFYWERSLIAH